MIGGVQFGWRNLSSAKELINLSRIPEILSAKKLKNLLARSWAAKHIVGAKCNFSRCNNLFKANHRDFGEAELSAIKLHKYEDFAQWFPTCGSRPPRGGRVFSGGSPRLCGCVPKARGKPVGNCSTLTSSLRVNVV